MAQIDIHRPHGMSEDAARRRAEDLARRLEQRRGVRWRWEGDELRLDAPSGHLANASWYRVKGKIDVNDLVPASETAWHARDPDKQRWLSTVHFMGTGYWLWFIPLSTGHTSIGVVVHDEVHPFETG